MPSATPLSFKASFTAKVMPLVITTTVVLSPQKEKPRFAKKPATPSMRTGPNEHSKTLTTRFDPLSATFK